MKKFPVIFLLISIACSDKHKYADETLALIGDLKDRRNTDSLLYFLRSENPAFRREAALAFGSAQDSSASLDLGNVLLEDPDTEVRRNAAYALGQTGGLQAVNALIPALEGKARTVVREALEALGKSATGEDADALTQFESTDTLLQEGKAWGLYRIALRGKIDTTTTRLATRFLAAENSYQTRLAASHYFSRAATLPQTGFEKELEGAVHDKRPEVRMAAVAGVKHGKPDWALQLLASILGSETDYRVRVSAVRACQNFVDSAAAKGIILGSLSDSSEMVQVAASEIVRRFGEKFNTQYTAEPYFNTTSPRAKANLYAAVLKFSGFDELPEDVKMYLNSDNVYVRAAFISALGDAKQPGNRKLFEILSSELLNSSNEKVILTTSAGAIVSLNRNSGKELPSTEFLEVYKKAIAGGDAGVIGVVCSALMDVKLPYKDLVKDLGFLYDAKAKLKFPDDLESIEPLERALAYLEGKERPSPRKIEFNNPIDWKLAGSLASDQQVEIITSKGVIVIRLLVEDAPGSVVNFVELAKRKFFDGKYFHRVVPNFVVQTGSDRGDGDRSEDYSIRSEFSPRRYTTGSVGMASAGKDTEGTQWFITHSPTPHLDGKYTIFAEVVSGMEAVHQLDVGDKILEVKLK